MKKLLWIAAFVMLAGTLHAQDLAGTWQGTMTAQSGKGMRIVLKIAKADNALSGTVYSIDINGKPYRTGPIRVQDGNVKFEVPGIGNAFGGQYTGKLSADGASISGTWTQDSTPLPLNLKHVSDAAAWEIPAIVPVTMMAADADPAFDVATIKPNSSGDPLPHGMALIKGKNYAARNVSLEDLVRFTYGVQTKQIAGAPEWMDKDRFDIAAVMDTEGRPALAQTQAMVRKLIADRFALKLHHEKRKLAAFLLTVGKDGPKMPTTLLDGPNPTDNMRDGSNGLDFAYRNATTADLVMYLQGLVLDRPVVDETGIKGKYDFVFTFMPDDSMFGGRMHIPPRQDSVEYAPTLFDALQRQSGLKLVPGKASVDVLVIDHVEKPSAN
jgi:uncharacterized protein (TIGR03435 family)